MSCWLEQTGRKPAATQVIKGVDQKGSRTGRRSGIIGVYRTLFVRVRELGTSIKSCVIALTTVLRVN